MKNFALGFLVSTTLFLGAFATYVLFCPHAKQGKSQQIMILMPPNLGEQTPVFPKG